MAACPAVAAARTEFCPRVGAVPNFRVRPEKVMDSASAWRLGFDRRVCRPLRIMSGYGKCPVRACTEHGGLESCTLYDFLGLPRHATQKNIKAAYRKSAKTWHPDIAMKGQLQKFSEEFVKIRDAYVVLSDPGARAHYDEQLRLQALQGRRMGNKFSGIVSVDQGDCFSIAPGNRKWETDQCW